jgi:acyl-CoA thioester hydrolase
MRRRGPISETTEVDVAFNDVDVMAVVWHGHYLRYLEAARWRLMDRLGYGFVAMRESGYLWPIIESHVRHVRSAAFGERLAVTASLVEWQTRLAINYLITEARSEARVARARTVQVAVDGATGVLQFACPPAFVRRVESTLAGSRA